MANAFIRTLLFLSSYIPLGLIFFVLFIRQNPWVAWTALLLSIAGLGGLFLYLQRIRSNQSSPLHVSTVQRNDAEAMSYIVSYVIPFLALQSSSVEQAVALIIFFVVLGILYVHSNMIHVNPTLNFMGYHLYEVTSKNGVTHALITRKRVVRGTKLNVVKAGDDILIDETV